MRPGVSYGKKPRSDGRWQGYVALSGKRRRTIIRRTEAEMRAEVDRLADQRDAGREPGTDDPTMTAYLARWIQQRRRGVIGGKALAPSTAIRYEQLARLQIAPTIGTVRLSRLNAGHLDSLIDTLRDARTSGSVRLQVFRLLNVALKHARRRGMIERNPCDFIDPPNRDGRVERELDTGDVAAILHAARGHPQEAMLWVAIATGIRQGELFALRWSDIDLDASRLTVREKVQHLTAMGAVRSPPKTRAGIRSMALPAVAVAALRSHRSAQDRSGRPNPIDLAFPASNGAHFRAGNWNRNVWSAWKAGAGLDPDTQFRALTRKAHASLMVALGVDPETVRHRSGHTSASTTFDHYVMAVSSADQDAAKLLDRELRRLAGQSSKPKNGRRKAV